jgi:hypothetical protein
MAADGFALRVFRLFGCDHGWAAVTGALGNEGFCLSAPDH